MKDLNLGIVNIEGQQYNLIVEVPDDFAGTSIQVKKLAKQHFKALFDAHKAAWGTKAHFWSSKKKPFAIDGASFDSSKATFTDGEQAHDKAAAQQHWNAFEKLFQKAVSRASARPAPPTPGSTPARLDTRSDTGAASAHVSPAASPHSASSTSSSGLSSPPATPPAHHHHHAHGQGFVHADCGASAAAAQAPKSASSPARARTHTFDRSSVVIEELDSEEETTDDAQDRSPVQVASGSGSVAGSAAPAHASSGAAHQRASPAEKDGEELDAVNGAGIDLGVGSPRSALTDEPAASHQQPLPKEVTTHSSASTSSSTQAQALTSSPIAVMTTQGKCLECWRQFKGYYLDIIQKGERQLIALIEQLENRAHAKELEKIKVAYDAHVVAVAKANKNRKAGAKAKKAAPLAKSLEQYIIKREKQLNINKTQPINSNRDRQ